MALAQVNLEDKYTLASGRIYLSGIQALVRVPLMQRQRDRAAGLNTAGFISGYRGSPLSGYDNALWQAQALLEQNDIRFQAGLNEDLAATAVWGSQQVGLFPGAKVGGVFGIWYGKGPGLDRSLDVLRHANWAGTSPLGGVLAIAGDDHAAQSTTTAYQCEQVFESAMMPTLNPATIQDYLDFGLFGFALSRFSGCWVGFKATAEAVDSSASVLVDPQRVAVAVPADFEMPPGGVHIRWPRPGMDYGLEQERRLLGPKLDAVGAFARANAIDRIVIDTPRPRFGIIATGKAYLDLRQALAELGITEAIAAELGLRVYKVGLTWPLEPEGALKFAAGLKDILVVEEKRGFVENQLVRLLYNAEASQRPSIVGKTDETGATLLRAIGELTPTIVARAVVARLKRLGAHTFAQQIEQRLARLESFERPLAAPASKIARVPFFCSGCPHNTSTRVPEGSRAMAGIGCHSMALFMPGRETATTTQMGGEGVNWIGQAPFTSEQHVFQNLGDGTYSHSGLLAIRAAAVAGVNITYKILYNDVVAMTGGQPVEGRPTVPQIAQQVLAEGAKRIVVVTDEPGKYPADAGFPAGIAIRHRDDLDAVQRELREVEGLTVLIYDQTCAAEKRRRRKRGLLPDPPERVFINEAVCEGCGDCSVKSNCISVVPVETAFGRKRQIDQSNCNKDFSCLKGFCPSFVTVRGATLRKLVPLAASDDLFARLAEPKPPPLDRPYSIVITGIGGTGVVTLGALLGMAAHLENKGCTVLDVSGLAQKNGAVMSHIRLASHPDELLAVRVGTGGADLLLGCDLIVAASPAALGCVASGTTTAVINSHIQPPAAFIFDPDIDFETAAKLQAVRTAAGDVDTIDATGLAAALMGDSIAANLFMLGYAYQKGLVPLSLAAIARAIALNGVAVESNRRSFNWGRLAAEDRAHVEALVRKARGDAAATMTAQAPDDLIDSRAAFLETYQNAAYAQRYRDLVAVIKVAETSRARGYCGLTEAVALNLFALMAYKDEYEVARLYTDGAFRKKLEQQFEGDFTLHYHLAPPLLARRDPATGESRKRAFGPWTIQVFKILARLRRLRGTPFDIFGRTQERRMERRLIADYEAIIRELTAALDPANHALAIEIASVPAKIRGFGPVKERNVESAKACEAELLMLWRRKDTRASAA
ncbi:MAG TPA: indolepyruvate ferredoxin oxidoreductase family protein [Xanthobacteraceae bacterium]|nr:indolepyruvate ferredoxin oxidoreductase family protein [Xanthobacteraceae bacterium]